MQIEYRQTSSDVSLDEQRGIYGLAAVFYDPDDPGTEYQLWRDTVERIDPAAFDRALKEADDVVGLFNHESSQLMGRTTADTLELKKSARGLEYRIPPNDTFWYSETAKQLALRNVTGSSFAFWPEVEEWQETDELTIRTIKSVQLVDVGPVTWPAFKSTEAGVRAEAARFAEARNRYDAWLTLQPGEVVGRALAREANRRIDAAAARAVAAQHDQARAAHQAALTRARRFRFLKT